MRNLLPLKKVFERILPGRQVMAAGGRGNPAQDRVILQGTGASSLGLQNLRQRINFLARLTALLLVALPTLIAAVYYIGFASDQFQVEARFGVRSGEGRGADALSALGALSGLPSTAASNDSHIIIDFIRSVDFVATANKTLDLKKIYHDKADLISRLSADAKLEDIVEYWRDMVRPRVDTPSQSVVVSVRAFSPEDAMQVAQHLIVRSERLVNELSEKSRNEALSSARGEVRIAEDRLRADREAVKKYRDSSKVLDPTRSVASRQELAGRIQGELASLNAEMRSLRGFLAADAPAIISLRSRIASLEAELTRVQSDASTQGDAGKLSNVIQSFENLQTETVFAEKAYVAALASLDRARAEADRKIKYLAVHVHPIAPEIATQPRRALAILTVMVICFMMWGTGWLVYLGIRDHMH